MHDSNYKQLSKINTICTYSANPILRCHLHEDLLSTNSTNSNFNQNIMDDGSEETKGQISWSILPTGQNLSTRWKPLPVFTYPTTKFDTGWPGIEIGLSMWEADDWPHEPRHTLYVCVCVCVCVREKDRERKLRDITTDQN